MNELAGTILFVNYHHVCDDADLRFPRLHHITCEQFESQIVELSRVFSFPSVACVEGAFLDGKAIDTPACVLSFDDGLAHHYRNVVPILKRHRISAIFSINTGPWIDGRLLSVHRAHLLSAAYSYEAIAESIESSAAEFNVEKRICDTPIEHAVSQYRYDSPETAQIKYYLNAVIPQEVRGEILRLVFRTYLGDDREYASAHYMAREQVRELARMGHTLALHTHRHVHLASATPEHRADDLYLNHALISELAGPTRWISYPYGDTTSYDEAVVSLAQAIGCEFGLTMTRGLNGFHADCMRLSRVDNNDVVGGRRPIDWSSLAK
jgi:peptidoglycan/xylan/chitin deacetylase (PgdA/CDA1 family)